MHHFHDFLCLTFQLKGTLNILLEPTKNLQALQILPVSKRSSFGEHEHTKEKTYKDSYFGFAKPITRLESGKASK